MVALRVVIKYNILKDESQSQIIKIKVKIKFNIFCL